MGWLELLLTGAGLSMDAFSVAICRGLKMRKFNKGHALIIAALFGGFQALMPLIGWALGKQFEQYIVAVDHWIAFGLLLFIGGKMIWDVIAEKRSGKCEEEAGTCAEQLDVKELLLMALATSIDALAVGITFAFLQVNIILAISIIGLTTFLLCLAGVAIGHLFGSRYRHLATLAGGIILILIGTKILIEHLTVG